MVEFDNSQHYKGLIAQWYDEVYNEELLDIEYYKKIINNSKPPILELGCGTGRILLNLLKLGLSVDGLDASSEMLEICRKKVKAQRFHTNLFNQKMEDMNLGKKYKTIFAAGGTFQLLDRYDLAMKTLQNVYEALDEGSRFIADIYLPWQEIIGNQTNLWKSAGTVFRQGNSRFSASYYSQYHLKRQVIERVYCYEAFKDNVTRETEFSKLCLKWYSIQEFKLMLEKTGFTDIKIEEQNILTFQPDTVVFFAHKK